MSTQKLDITYPGILPPQTYDIFIAVGSVSNNIISIPLTVDGGAAAFGEPVHSITALSGAPLRVSADPAGTLLAVSAMSSPSHILLDFDPENGFTKSGVPQPSGTSGSTGSGTIGAAFGRTGEYVAFGVDQSGHPGRAWVYSPSGGQPIDKTGSSSTTPLDIDWRLDDKHFLIAQSPTIGLWAWNGVVGSLVASVSNSGHLGMRISSDGERAIGSRNDSIGLFGVTDTSLTLLDLIGHSGGNIGGRHSISPDRSHAAIGSTETGVGKICSLAGDQLTFVTSIPGRSQSCLWITDSILVISTSVSHAVFVYKFDGTSLTLLENAGFGTGSRLWALDARVRPVPIRVAETLEVTEHKSTLEISRPW